MRRGILVGTENLKNNKLFGANQLFMKIQNLDHSYYKTYKDMWFMWKKIIFSCLDLQKVKKVKLHTKLRLNDIVFKNISRNETKLR